MLFVLGLVPLPNGNWMIRDTRLKADARSNMMAWLEQIRKVCANLPDSLSTLRQMLDTKLEDRITPTQLVTDLHKMQRIEMAPANFIAQPQ